MEIPLSHFSKLSITFTYSGGQDIRIYPIVYIGFENNIKSIQSIFVKSGLFHSLHFTICVKWAFNKISYDWCSFWTLSRDIEYDKFIKCTKKRWKKICKEESRWIRNDETSSLANENSMLSLTQVHKPVQNFLNIWKLKVIKTFVREVMFLLLFLESKDYETMNLILMCWLIPSNNNRQGAL